MATETLRPTFPSVTNAPNAKLSYGLPFHESCVKHLETSLHCSRPYIISSNTLSKRTPFLQQLESAIKASDKLTLAGTWIGIPGHSPIDSLLPIVKEIRQNNADAIITLGGGSLTDGAKMISLILGNPEITTREQALSLPSASKSDLAHDAPERCAGPSVPVICIPTTLSGAEYSKFAGIVDNVTHSKIQFTHPRLFPALVILDSELMMSIPLRTWIASGVRAIDHCVEGYLSVDATGTSDDVVLEGVSLLVDGLLETNAKSDESKDARLNCALGSNLSLSLLFMGIRKGASHGIGHQLGPLGVPHGETSCVLLPAVCRWNACVNGAKQEKLKDVLLDLNSVKEVIKKQNTKVEDLADVLRAIFDALDVPKSLKEVGIEEQEKLEQLAVNCLTEPYVESNPRPMQSQEDVLAFLATVST